ncbi:MAG: type II toxin-antitoxin system Phd/YefM family antitoxin [Magnetococcales bacterium]|nr:type II toxin-antitoxin system Phd/YefM family antitoxin [Magnetococcales bacterium]
MTVFPETIPWSDLHQDAVGTLQRLEHSLGPLVITQGGQAAAVLMGIDFYECAEEERRLLRRLAKGEQEIRDGQGHTLEDVLAEASALLSSASA